MSTTEHHVATPSSPSSPSTARPTVILLAGAASVAAGLVHAAAAGAHNDDATRAWIFAGCAVAQLLVGALLLCRPRRGELLAVVVVNAAAVGAWVLSRTTGLPAPMEGVDPVGTQDLLCAVLGGIAVAACLARLLTADPRRDRRPASAAAVAIVSLLVVALALPAMAAEHDHGHEHGDEVATAHDHSTGSGTGDDVHQHAGSGSDTTPVVSVDDPRLSGAQRGRATDLLVSTRNALRAFPDEAALVAAGYRSIGDGRRAGSFEHFVQATFMEDGQELDASAIESIVMQRGTDGTKEVVSAMYILEPGTTMEEAPDIAGSLTPWHDHRNLCFDGNRLAGVLVAGSCRPGGTLRITPPMVHVWIEDTPCGPFAGTDDHGGGDCTHEHA